MSAAEPDVVDGAAIRAMAHKIARATADKNGTTDTNIALHALMHALAVLTIHSCPANAEFVAMREVEPGGAAPGVGHETAVQHRAGSQQ